jgi:predicted transcriptional regulator
MTRQAVHEVPAPTIGVPGEMTQQAVREVRALTIRVPEDIHEALRGLAFATGESINEIAVRALRDFLASEGHREAVDAFFGRAQERLRVAFDKLADL